MKTIAEEIIRQEIKCGYRVVTHIESGGYFAPYRPGMTSEEVAEITRKITEDGQRALTEIQKRINGTVGLSVYGDTDSVMKGLK